jgi:hypothetical protein
VGSKLLLNPAFWAGMSRDQGVDPSRQWQVNAYFLFSRSSREDWIPDGMVAASLDRNGLGRSTISDWIFAESERGAPLDLFSESGDDVLSDPTWPGCLGR